MRFWKFFRMMLLYNFLFGRKRETDNEIIKTDNELSGQSFDPFPTQHNSLFNNGFLSPKNPFSETDNYGIQDRHGFGFWGNPFKGFGIPRPPFFDSDDDCDCCHKNSLFDDYDSSDMLDNFNRHNNPFGPDDY